MQFSIGDIGMQESFLLEGVNHPKEVDPPLSTGGCFDLLESHFRYLFVVTGGHSVLLDILTVTKMRHVVQQRCSRQLFKQFWRCWNGRSA